MIELIGEWNDAIENDIMTLKREVIDKFMIAGIFKFILIVENVLNFHSGDKDYYEEWYEEVDNEHGWIAYLDMPEPTQYDFRYAKLDRFINVVELHDWRVYKPFHLFKKIDQQLLNRLQ